MSKKKKQSKICPDCKSGLKQKISKEETKNKKFLFCPACGYEEEPIVTRIKQKIVEE